MNPTAEEKKVYFDVAINNWTSKLWQKLQQLGWYIGKRAGCLFVHQPDGRYVCHSHDRKALLERIGRQFD